MGTQDDAASTRKASGRGGPVVQRVLIASILSTVIGMALCLLFPEPSGSSWDGSVLESRFGPDYHQHDFRGTDLRGLSFFEADLSDLDFTGADLRRADLRKTDLDRTRLNGADLRKANLEGLSTFFADLSGARLDCARLGSATFFCTRLVGADLEYADLEGASFNGADLRGADLKHVRNWKKVKSISGANLHGVKHPPRGFIEWAIVRGALFVEDEEQARERQREYFRLVLESL